MADSDRNHLHEAADGAAALAAISESGALPLWTESTRNRPIAWRTGRVVSLHEFAAGVAALRAQLPAAGAMINLCEERYRFLVAYAAAQSSAHSVLLPSSRAEQIVTEVERATAGSYRCDDAQVEAALLGSAPISQGAPPDVAASHVCMIGFTSGSTGEPKRFPKRWRSVHGSNACNAAVIREALGLTAQAVPWIVATVPPQHMYGMELTVLLPLIGGMAVHAGRPLFPADIARALAEVPEPRVLVSTPVHLRAVVESEVEFPRTALIVSATAPLDAALAQAVESKLGGQLLEMFGSTETCVFAHRYTAREEVWRHYPGVRLTPLAHCTQVDAPWFAAPMLLQDVLELRGADGFVVRGRNNDMVDVAGKRASLADLTRRLLAVQGVKDAAVFQPDPEAIGSIRRLAALVVAPGRTSKEILEQLADSVDPAFLPRPLLIVDALPRNELGKLPREQLLQALKR